MSTRDVGAQTAERLAREWSAPRMAAQLQPEQLQALSGRFEGMEPLAKARALLTGAFARPDTLAACREGLRDLAATARGDDDEWVRVIGRAVGSFDGRLDLDAVTSESRLVARTLAELNRLLDKHPPCPEFFPLEELYLSPRARAARGAGGGEPRQHSHFRVRHPASAAAGGDARAAALPAVPPQLTVNVASQAGYSEKLGTTEPATVAVSAAAPLPGRNSATGAAGDVMSRGPAVPSASPRHPAAAAADMFLSLRPTHAHRSGPSGERQERRGLMKQTRTKQIDVKEVAALHRAQAEEAAATAAAPLAADAAAPAPAARELAANGTALPEAESDPESGEFGGIPPASGSGRQDSAGRGGADSAGVSDRRRHTWDSNHGPQRAGSGVHSVARSPDRWHSAHGHSGEGDWDRSGGAQAWGGELGSGGLHQRQLPERRQEQNVAVPVSSPESGQVEAEEGEVPSGVTSPSPAKRPRTDGGTEWL